MRPAASLSTAGYQPHSQTMSDRNLAFIYAPEVDSLSYPPECPFKTTRAGLTRRKLISFGLLGLPTRAEIAPEKASLADLAKFHPANYLEELQRAAGGELTAAGLNMGLGGMDTPVFRELFDYGSWACGGALKAADLLLAGQADVAFNLMGGFHHAFADRAEGFCYLNDVVLACMRLTDAGKRVAYVDIDAHHGDGVQSAFYHRKDVLTISLHESGKTLFPWGGFENEIGEGAGEGFNVNLSLPADTYDEAFLHAFDRVPMPLLGAYQPDVIVLELGMDTLAGDPLTHLHMTNNATVEVVRRLLRWRRPILVCGGGGYNVENTVRGWALAWRTFAGEGDEDDFSIGMGGCMLGSSEWAGGLRDRDLAVTTERRAAVEPELNASIEAIIKNIFPYHGLAPQNAPAVSQNLS